MDIAITGTERTAATRALVAAAAAASLAPSIHNTQPWRWLIHTDVADLYADTSRQLHVTDPDGRLLTLSCGAALHHARVALAADGMAFEVIRPPGLDLNPTQTGTAQSDAADHLARIVVTGRAPVSAAAMRLYQAAKIRHTDRRPLLDERLPAGALAALVATATAFGTGLRVLSRGQVIELAAATSQAQRGKVNDDPSRLEPDAWTGQRRPADAGIPDADIPEQATPTTTVPMRDFGHVGALPVTGGHDNTATYALLHGPAEQPGDWLRAGEALSAIWLAAADRLIAVLPLSAAVELPATRERLHRILAGVGYPYLALRLGIGDPNLPSPPRTPRLPADSTVDVAP